MQTVGVELKDRSYDILIKAGEIVNTGRFVRKKCGKNGTEACIITSATVAGLYLETVGASLEREGYRTIRIILADGEEHKTVAIWESILANLIKEKFERSSVIVALGGGVIGDIGGFVAASYLRGVPFIQIPTTIVAQVDSSIGGKVGVNHTLGKNLIGSFYQPKGVLIDPRVLATLDNREIVSGMGEVVKHAIIMDRDFFQFINKNLEKIMTLKASDDMMEKFIAWNCRIKAEVVSSDEKETGVRAILNYGHTIGHALEAATGYRRFSHGQAVIFGMIAAAKIASLKGFLPAGEMELQNHLLRRVGASGKVDDLSPRVLLEAMTRDKKMSGGKMRFILPHVIGSVRIHDDVEEKEIVEAIRYMFEFASGKH